MSNNANPNKNRPGRQKHVVGQGKDIYKRGEGLGTGPVGSSQGHVGRQDAVSSQNSPQHPQQQTQQRQTRSGKGGLIIIAVLAVLLLGGGGGLSGLFGNLLGGDSTGLIGSLAGDGPTQSYTTSGSTQQSSIAQQSALSGLTGGGVDLSSLLGFSGLGGSSGSASTAAVAGSSSGWSAGSNVRQLDTSVASGSRAKRTQILGGGKDTITMMVYMCGTDLESKSGMATADLNEMISADLSDNITLLVYTGGCKQWSS